jgi:hypothetical protein
MKVTLQQLTEFVKAAGVAHVEVVEDESQSDYNIDNALTEIDSSRTSIIRPKIEQEIQTNAQGKVFGIVKGALARITGAGRGEIDKFEKIEEAIDFAVKHKSSLLEGSQSDIDAKFNALAENHQKEKDALKAEYESKISEATNKYVQRDIQNSLATQLGSAPLPDNTDRLIAANDFQKHLAEKYHVTYDEAAKMIKLYDKENNAAPALNSSKTNPVNIMDEAKEYFTPRGLWRTDMRDVNPKEAMEQQRLKTYEANKEQRANPVDPIDAQNKKRIEYIAKKQAEIQQ